MSRDLKKHGCYNDDIIPIQGEGIDLSALSHSGFFGCSPFETKQDDTVHIKNPKEKTEYGITLKAVALDYASHLPQRIKVLKGVNWDDRETSFSAGDMYDIHFIRTLKTVTIRSVLGQEYQISYDSAVRAAFIFRNVKPQSPILGHNSTSFTRVANVVASNPMPKVLCTTKSYLGSSPATSIEENEIIAVLSVTSFKGYKYLHVYSFTTKCEKRLPLICDGHFTTNPARIHVPLCELLEHAKDLRMSRVIFFPEENNADALPQAFFNEMFTITDFGNTTVLVGVPYSEQGKSDIVVEFSSDLKAEILLLPINMADHKAKSTTLIEEYDRRRAHYFKVRNDESRRDQIGNELCMTLDVFGCDEAETVRILHSKCDMLEEIISIVK